jgi:hypothetical protein
MVSSKTVFGDTFVRKFTALAATLLMLGAALPLATPAAFAKSENAATGIGKNGTPPGKAKTAGQSAKSFAPGQTKTKAK